MALPAPAAARTSMMIRSSLPSPTTICSGVTPSTSAATAVKAGTLGSGYSRKAAPLKDSSAASARGDGG